MAGAQWGSSVDIVGSSVIVGAAGRSRTAVYDLNQGDYTAWSVKVTGLADSICLAHLGSSVAIAGTTAVLGAPDYGNRGAIFVYKQIPNADPSLDPVWELQTQIDAPGFQTGDDFGASVAINGDYLIVGAPGRNGDQGGAYIFHRLNGQWTLQKELNGNVAGERSGMSVDIGAEYAVAGAPGGTNPSVYLYRKLPGSWSSDATLTTPQSGNGFGAAVHLDSSNLFVGAPADSTRPGEVWIYGLAPHAQNVSSNVSSGPTALPATGGANGDLFGASLDGSGSYLVIGAPGAASQTGAAYVFQRPTEATPWVQTLLDYSAGSVSGDRFGSSVAIDGTQIIVGAPGRIQTTGTDGMTYTQG